MVERRSSIKIIPEEILTDILIRLPAKSVGRSRCVSKHWRRLLSDSLFIKAHFDRTKLFIDNELLMLRSDGSNTLCSASIARHTSDEITVLTTELSFVMGHIYQTQNIPSCDGLMLIKNNTKMLLVNPTTKEVRELPFPPYRSNHGSIAIYGLGYDHAGDDYKIVTVSYYRSPFYFEIFADFYDHQTFVDVYSVKNGTWKQITSSTFDHAVQHDHAGVFVGGSVHWIAKNIGFSPSIVGFDLTEEKFQEVAAPSSIFGGFLDGMRDSLSVIEGCLCVLNSKARKETIIWVMKEYGVEQSWTKLSIVDDGLRMFRPLLCMSREVVMVKDERTTNEKLVMYNLDSATFRDVTIQRGIVGLRIRGSFRETMVSPFYNSETRIG